MFYSVVLIYHLNESEIKKTLIIIENDFLFDETDLHFFAYIWYCMLSCEM